MATNFRVELEELEAIRAKLQGLLEDHFQSTTSPLAATTYHNNTASDIQQTALSGQLRRSAEMDGGAASTNFGPTDQGIEAITNLNNAHGQVQQAIYALIGDVNQKLQDLHNRIQQTHQMYSVTESNLQIDMTQVQKDT